MVPLSTHQIAALVVGVAFAGYAAVGALAAPQITPWNGGGGASVAGVEEPTEALETAETSDLDQTDISDVDMPDLDGERGVPADSPACENVGCRDVTTADGETKHLPNPAADGIERAKELHQEALERREDAQQNGNDPVNGPPDGVPQGAPDDLPYGPPDGVPQGPPDETPNGAPDGLPGGPPGP